MGRKPVINGLKRGPWSADEDLLLIKYVEAHGEGHWSSLPSKAGLLQCGKSCRLRWMNYLRPTVKRGNISKDEEDLIFRLHNLLGNRWSLIAARIPGRTDSEVKNFWNTYMSKKIGGGTGLAYINNSMNIHKPIIRPEAYKPPVDCFTDLLQRDQHQEVNRICLDRNESMDKKPNANPDTAKDLECTASSKSSSDVEPQYESSLQAQYTTVMENSHNKSINSSHETTIDDFIDYICNNFDKDASPSLCQTYSSDTLISDTAGIIAAEHELGEIASNNYKFCAAPYDQATMNYVEPSVFTDTNFPATELVTLEDAPLSSLSWVQFEMHSVDGIQPTFIHSGINLEDGSQELNMVNFHKLDQPFNTDPEQGNSSMSLFSYLNSLGSF